MKIVCQGADTPDACTPFTISPSKLTCRTHSVSDDGQGDKPKRGEWMTQLPTDRHGLSALVAGAAEQTHRSFSAYVASTAPTSTVAHSWYPPHRRGVHELGDQSSWTATPEEKAKAALEAAHRYV